MTRVGPWLAWWLMAPALGAITVGFWVVFRRPLGVSGIITRALAPRAALEVERAEASAPVGDAELEAALLAATREAFGDRAPLAEQPQLVAQHGRALGPQLPLAGQALFLAGIAAGGFLARLARGAPVDPSLGVQFARVVGSGLPGLALLAIAGFLVGWGTCFAGGCSTGHGLSGCSRLQPGSLAAAACFMGTAMAVSLLLARLA